MRKLTNEEFINKCINVWNSKYSYIKTSYTKNDDYIIVTCFTHGDFSILATNHLHLKQGCKQCALEKHKLVSISEDRLSRMISMHNDQYQYIDLSVVNGKIKIICKVHGEFTQSIYHHEKGHGCYQCEKESRRKVRYRKCRLCNEKRESSNYGYKLNICNVCVDNSKNLKSKECKSCSIMKDIDLFPIRKEAKDGRRTECKECIATKKKTISAVYRKKNKATLREKDKIYRKKRMDEDAVYKAKIIARTFIRKSISRGGYSKKSRTHEILGCSYEEFKIHIESQFIDNMSWNNRDMWHIDHIVPLSFGETEEEVLVLNHYSNLRPMWGVENEMKSDNIIEKNSIYNEIISMRAATSIH